MKTNHKFEPAMKRLNEISTLMNNDDLSLEEALELYKEAGELTELCKAEMKDAQLALKEIFTGG
jgi:exodeoxyribonuclease VII small subunit